MLGWHEQFLRDRSVGDEPHIEMAFSSSWDASSMSMVGRSGLSLDGACMCLVLFLAMLLS